MQAVLFKEKQVSIIEKPVPAIGEGEVLVRTKMAGICTTDIELFSGYYRFQGVAGHEFVGVVDQSPPGTALSGKRVVADINCGCGQCPWCLNGNERHCPQRTTIGISGRDGAFGEYLTVPVRNIHTVADAIETPEAVFTEPLAAALEISQQVHLNNQTRLAVLGDGKLGLLAALGLHHYCPHLVLLGKHADKLHIAAEQGVETRQINPERGHSPLVAQLGLFDVVVEATGNAHGINLAMELARPEGTVVTKTTTRKPSRISLANIVVKELHVIGSRCGDLDLALHFLKNKWIDVKPLIECVYPFADFQKAFDHARRQGAKKVLVSFD